MIFDGAITVHRRFFSEEKKGMRTLFLCFFLCLCSSTVFASESADRFVDNGDGTVADTVTGIMWMKDPDFIGSHCKKESSDFLCELLITREAALLPWARAQQIVRLISFAGHSDWRLPSKKEIRVLNKIHKGELSNPFGNFMPIYWTSSPGKDSKTYWMFFPSKEIFTSIKRDTLGFVWPVRNASAQ